MSTTTQETAPQITATQTTAATQAKRKRRVREGMRRVSLTLPEGVVARLKALSKELGVPPSKIVALALSGVVGASDLLLTQKAKQ